MRSVAVVSISWVFAGFMPPQSDVNAANLGRGCPSSYANVGTLAWIQAYKGLILADHPSSIRFGALSGLVIDHSGAPLAGVEVALRRGRIPPGDDGWFRVRSTKADGRFQFDSLSALDYMLQFKKPAFETQWHAYRGVRGIVDSLCVPLRAEPPLKLAPLSPN